MVFYYISTIDYGNIWFFFIIAKIKSNKPLTRNIAKSGKVLSWNGVSLFQLYFDLKLNYSQPASCHIAIRYAAFYGDNAKHEMKRFKITSNETGLLKTVKSKHKQ
jgi:hypothetical protein